MSSIEVILLRTVRKLGTVGTTVSVKRGYATNHLIPKEFAVRNTKTNADAFAAKKALIEQNEAVAVAAATKIKDQIDGQSISIQAHADDAGHLYGSVTGREIAAKCAEVFGGVTIPPESFLHVSKLKQIGDYEVEVELHSGIVAHVNLSLERI